MLAPTWAHAKICQILVENGADIDASDDVSSYNNAGHL